MSPRLYVYKTTRSSTFNPLYKMSNELSLAQIEETLQSHYIGHLAYTLDNKPFVVPITYLYDAEHNSLIGYTAEGHKIEVMRKNPYVCVEVSSIRDLSHWKSVVVEGTYEELSGMDAVNALQSLVSKLERLINEEGKQHVDQIREMARANDKATKVIYRINISQKVGRFEAGDPKLAI